MLNQVRFSWLIKTKHYITWHYSVPGHFFFHWMTDLLQQNRYLGDSFTELSGLNKFQIEGAEPTLPHVLILQQHLESRISGWVGYKPVSLVQISSGHSHITHLSSYKKEWFILISRRKPINNNLGSASMWNALSDSRRFYVIRSIRLPTQKSIVNLQVYVFAEFLSVFLLLGGTFFSGVFMYSFQQWQSWEIFPVSLIR